LLLPGQTTDDGNRSDAQMQAEFDALFFDWANSRVGAKMMAYTKSSSPRRTFLGSDWIQTSRA
jgi:hypothetical protein